jgi:hypothetical protein
MNHGQAVRKAIETGVNQIAIEEREAWFWGDSKKVLKGYFCIVGKNGSRIPYTEYYELCQ